MRKKWAWWIDSAYSIITDSPLILQQKALSIFNMPGGPLRLTLSQRIPLFLANGALGFGHMASMDQWEGSECEEDIRELLLPGHIHGSTLANSRQARSHYLHHYSWAFPSGPGNPFPVPMTFARVDCVGVESLPPGAPFSIILESGRMCFMKYPISYIQPNITSMRRDVTWHCMTLSLKNTMRHRLA